jgi:hypothetical protein
MLSAPKGGALNNTSGGVLRCGLEALFQKGTACHHQRGGEELHMKHLNPELEKLEERAVPWGIGLPISIGIGVGVGVNASVGNSGDSNGSGSSCSGSQSSGSKSRGSCSS